MLVLISVHTASPPSKELSPIWKSWATERVGHGKKHLTGRGGGGGIMLHHQTAQGIATVVGQDNTYDDKDIPTDFPTDLSTVPLQ